MQPRLFFLVIVCLSWLPSITHAQKKQPNVLFIFVDDLRPDLGCYGNPEVRTPHIDALAGSGVLFNRQYVAVPTCGASRASILTGKYPRKRSDITNSALERSVSGKPPGPHPETFIEQFKRNGYYTVGIGKISHSADGYLYGYDQPRSNQLELPNSWNEMLFDAGKWETGWDAFFGYEDGSSRTSRKGMVKPYEAGPGVDESYPDGRSAALAVRKIKTLSKQAQPFFLAVGFFKPHLPFNAPRKYWDLYETSRLSLASFSGIPTNVNRASLHNSAEFNQYRLGEEHPSLEHPVTNPYARKLRHGYYASVSYIDAQVGRLLNALKENGLDQNTIVVLWGDHGWHLGDHRVWGKHTLFDPALRSAFIVKTPQMREGAVCEQVVSATDVYPTLMDLCRLPQPPGLDGSSLVPLMDTPTASREAKPAFSYYNRGISIRTDRYRLTRYFRDLMPTIELYDHQQDPHEQHNVAADNPKVVARIMTAWKTKIDAAQQLYAVP